VSNTLAHLIVAYQRVLTPLAADRNGPGFRSLEELEAAFPDCIVRTYEARALLSALFPKQLSDVWPVV
jgi:hypothetical protein